jgi:hypothetical protein
MSLLYLKHVLVSLHEDVVVSMKGMSPSARKHVRVPPHRNAVPTESHSDGQRAGCFPGTLRTLLLVLGFSKPPLFMRTPRLFCGNSYICHVRVVIYERPMTDQIHHIRQVVEAFTPWWTFVVVMRVAD